MNIEDCRKLVALEARLQVATKEISDISNELQKMGKDVKVSGWDWKCSGNITEISTQAHLTTNIVDTASRP